MVECPFLPCNTAKQTLKGTRNYVIRVSCMFMLVVALNIALCFIHPDLYRIWWFYFLIIWTFITSCVGIFGAYTYSYNTMMFFGVCIGLKTGWTIFVEIELILLHPDRALETFVPIIVIRALATLLLIYVYVLFVLHLDQARDIEGEPLLPEESSANIN